MPLIPNAGQSSHVFKWGSLRLLMSKSRVWEVCYQRKEGTILSGGEGENWQGLIIQEVSYVTMRLKDQHLASLRHLYYLEI